MIFLVLFLILSSAGLLSGQDLEAMDLGDREDNSIKGWAPMMVGFGILLVFGLAIPWAVYSAMRQRYDAVMVVFGSIMLCAISFSLFFGDISRGGIFSHDAAETAPWYTYDWAVYGSDQSSLAHYPSQTVSYEIVRGWALAGAVLFYRFIDWGFASLIIPLIAFGGVLYAVRQSQQQRSIRPIAVHGVMILILFPLLVLPVVHLQNATDDNPVYKMVSQQAADNSDAPSDAPRVSPLVAVSFTCSPTSSSASAARSPSAPRNRTRSSSRPAPTPSWRMVISTAT